MGDKDPDKVRRIITQRKPNEYLTIMWWFVLIFSAIIEGGKSLGHNGKLLKRGNSRN